jgi:hypothetical protein
VCNLLTAEYQSLENQFAKLEEVSFIVDHRDISKEFIYKGLTLPFAHFLGALCLKEKS